VLHGGQIVTVHEAFSISQAVAVSDGVLSAVGRDDDVIPFAGPDTLVVDLEGRTVIPGILDPHTHHKKGSTATNCRDSSTS
jgi:predicted amidohydrolase YtcJ